MVAVSLIWWVFLFKYLPLFQINNIHLNNSVIKIRQLLLLGNSNQYLNFKSSTKLAWQHWRKQEENLILVYKSMYYEKIFNSMDPNIITYQTGLRNNCSHIKCNFLHHSCRHCSRGCKTSDIKWDHVLTRVRLYWMLIK